MSPTPERFHSLDAVRAAAMMLGLFFHGAISFMSSPTPWAVRDRAASVGVDLFVWVCHTFRMPVFFLMSGFFARLVALKLGLAGFVRHRFKRIALPFLAALPPTMASAFFLWRWGWSKTPPPKTSLPGLETPSLELSSVTPSPAHLWFLYYLMILLAAVVALLAAGRRAGASRIGFIADALFGAAARSWVLPFVAAVPTAVTLYFMDSIEVATPVTFVPQVRVLAYYAVFFAFGWMLHRRPALVPVFCRRLGLYAALAAALLPPLCWYLLASTEFAGDLTPALRAGALYASALFGWSMTLLFVGVFVRWLSRPRAWVRWLADASYWCYLVHLPVVVFFQIVAANWALPGPMKYALVMAATLAACLGSYRALVRYTFLGAVLNGRRDRPEAASAPVAVGETR